MPSSELFADDIVDRSNIQSKIAQFWMMLRVCSRKCKYSHDNVENTELPFSPDVKSRKESAKATDI